jgi:hemolysin activation/secretion protein
LLPGAQLGEGTLTLDVVRKRPYKLYAGADDYTTPSVGGYTGRVGGWIDNLTGIGERIGADFVTTGRGVTGFSTNLDLPLNAYDTRATFRYNQTHTVLTEKPADVLNIKTQITGIEGGVYHPFYRSQNINLTAGVNFSIRKSYSTFLGIPQSFTDGLDNVGTIRVSVLRLWQQYVQQNANNEFFMRSTFSKGLDVLGATIQHDKLLPSGEFFSWLGQMQYRYIMDNGTQFVAKGTIELAANPLLPLERFAVGGVYSVRGYRENYYVRDNGFYTGVEVRYPLLGGELGSKNGLFLVPFMDYGGAWNNPTRLVLNPKKDYLHSVGIGINGNYEFGNHELPLGVAAELYWAHDLVGVKLPNSDRNIQDNGIHFKISFSAF